MAKRKAKKSKKTKAVSRKPKKLIPLEELKLPLALQGILQQHGIDSANELEGYSKADLMRMPNIGMKSVDWIRSRLKEKGFGFGVAGARRRAASMALDAEPAADNGTPTGHAPATPSRRHDPRCEQPAEMKTRIIEVELEPKDYNWLIWRARTWGTTVKHVMKKIVREHRAADHTRGGQAPTTAEDGGTVPERDYSEGHREGVRGSAGITDDGL